MPQASEGEHRPFEDPFHLEEGVCYLVRGKDVDACFRLFRVLVGHGREGFCITRIYPEKVQKRYGLEGTPVHWLSQSPGEGHLDPSAVGTLAQSVETFLQAHPEHPVVMLDGVEFIANLVGFTKLVLFVEHLNELVMPRRANLLIPVDPACFQPNESARLERFLGTLEDEEIRVTLDAYELGRGFL